MGGSFFAARTATTMIKLQGAPGLEPQVVTEMIGPARTGPRQVRWPEPGQSVAMQRADGTDERARSPAVASPSGV